MGERPWLVAEGQVAECLCISIFVEHQLQVMLIHTESSQFLLLKTGNVEVIIGIFIIRIIFYQCSALHLFTEIVGHGIGNHVVLVGDIKIKAVGRAFSAENVPGSG